MLLGAGQLPAQRINLETLPEAERNSKLIEIAKAAVLKYGPGYWREYKNTGIKKPEIRQYIAKDGESIAVSWPELKGKKVYYIKFFYDQTKERLRENFAADVTIVAESGVACDIWFGNARGLGTYHHETGKTKSSGHAVVPYRQAPTRPMIRPKDPGEN